MAKKLERAKITIQVDGIETVFEGVIFRLDLGVEVDQAGTYGRPPENLRTGHGDVLIGMKYDNGPGDGPYFREGQLKGLGGVA